MNLSAFPPPASQRSPAILIVDDAPANLGVLRAMMTQQGYQTFVATSGERAISIAQRERPDLILLDVVMPGMDGFETCRQLKGDAGTERIPVIFMSAKSDTDDIVAGFDIGAVDYIGKPLRMAEVCARVRAQLQLRSTSEAHIEQAGRLRMIVNAMDEGLMIIEASGRIQSSNPACARYLGYGPNGLAGLSLPDLLSAPQSQEYSDYFAADAAARTTPPAGAREVLIRHSDGVLRAMDLTLTPMVAGEAPFIGLLHDITHHKQSETALQHAAMVDQLTQIANRRRFDSFLEQEWHRALRSGQPLSLIVLDVDHFKLYNDTLGHAAGDLCLQQVAAALQSRALRSTDLAARYGGEEFVLLFAETALDTAVALAEAIRAQVEGLQLAHPRSPTSGWLTVSIGVASITPTQSDRIEQFFVAADRMMYAAKEAGRNRVEAVGQGGPAWDQVKSLVMI
jgi:diguanylate cyclase (GGDEF)-like protein/PAS domain S-box-containing protein